MKKIGLIIVMLSAFAEQQLCKAQTNVYHPFPDSNAVWNVFTAEYCNMGFDSWKKSYSCTFAGDTLINDTIYNKLVVPAIVREAIFGQCNATGTWVETGYYVGAIRQNIPDRKVFYVPTGEATEQLLYDFNLQLGDTVRGFLEDAFTANDTVIAIDSVLVGNDYRKRWYINSIYQIYLIEGIGSASGLLEPSPGMATDFHLASICFIQDGVVLYSDLTTACELITDVGNYEPQTQFTLFPNPATSTLTIQLAAGSGQYAATILNAQGQLVKSSIFNIQRSVFDISSFSPGIYFLTLDNGEQTVSRKFVKQ